MSDWLRKISRWLQHYVIGAPLYVAGPMMILIGALPYKAGSFLFYPARRNGSAEGLD